MCTLMPRRRGDGWAAGYEPRGAGEPYLSILLRNGLLRAFQFAAPSFPHDGQVLFHALHVRLHLVA